MQIKNIHLVNYRGMEDLTVEFEPGVNLIIGDNGAGKSSLLSGLSVALAHLLTGNGETFFHMDKEDVRATVHPAGDATTSVEYHTPTIVEGGFEFLGGTWHYSCKKDNEVSPPLVEIPSGQDEWDKMKELFNDNNARQLIHITYGLILSARNEDGSFRFKTRLYAFWRAHSEEYAQALEKHIGRHLSMLGCPRAD